MDATPSMAIDFRGMCRSCVSVTPTPTAFGIRLTVWRVARSCGRTTPRRTRPGRGTRSPNRSNSERRDD